VEPKRNQIIIDGVAHLVVIPAKHMFNSSMVHDVITTGGMFVVNTETNELKIHRPKKKKVVPEPVPKYWYNHMGRWKPLSEELEVAMVQLADEATAGHIGGAVRSSVNRKSGVIMIKGITPGFLSALKAFYGADD